jgi:hypothetical protein
MGTNVTARPEDYIIMAEECERHARRADDPKVKAQLLELAQQWRLLAEKAGRLLS